MPLLKLIRSLADRIKGGKSAPAAAPAANPGSAKSSSRHERRGRPAADAPRAPRREPRPRDDADRSTLSFIRRSADGQHELVFVANLTPVPREKFRLGVPQAGHYRELLNSDATAFGGSGSVASGLLATQPHPLHGQAQSIELTLPPLASVYLVREAEAQTVSPARRTRRKR